MAMLSVIAGSMLCRTMFRMQAARSTTAVRFETVSGRTKDKQGQFIRAISFHDDTWTQVHMRLHLPRPQHIADQTYAFEGEICTAGHAMS